MTFQGLILKLSEFWASHGCALQQPLDIVELKLRPRGIGKAAAQLFEHAAGTLERS